MSGPAISGDAKLFASGVADREAYLSHIKNVNDVFYDQIKISDQKAAYILTFMLAFLVTSEERSVFTIERYKFGLSVNTVLSIILAVASVVSIFCSIMVILPRHVDKSTSLFWGAWPKHKDALRDAAHSNNPDYLFEQYFTNADVLSFIARDKYRYVKFAFRSLLVTVLSYVALLLAAG